MNAPAPKPPLAMFPYRDRFPVAFIQRMAPRTSLLGIFSKSDLKK